MVWTFFLVGVDFFTLSMFLLRGELGVVELPSGFVGAMAVLVYVPGYRSG